MFDQVIRRGITYLDNKHLLPFLLPFVGCHQCHCHHCHHCHHRELTDLPNLHSLRQA